MKALPNSLVEFFDQFPPFMVYALARDGKHRKRSRLTPNQLAKAANLPVRTFVRLSSKLTWEREKLCVIDSFCKACDFNHFKTEPHRAFIRKTFDAKRPFSHLSKFQLDRLRQKWKAFDNLKVLVTPSNQNPTAANKHPRQ